MQLDRLAPLFALILTAGTVAAAELHWAYRPLPETAPAEGFIDARVNRARQAAGLTASPEADRRTLIRRLSFDLIGLPPSPEEVEAFASDPRPDAVSALIDRLLASPRHGERWARHWLDAVRFAESDGFETNQPRPNAWPYRDYVIRALNEDKPFDLFVREQLAGDQLGVDEATGFIVGGPWDRVKSPDPVLTANQRADELHDMVSVTGSAFLGLSVGCARCHNHKFDPVSQSEYFALVACFAGVQHGERERRLPNHDVRAREAEQLRAERLALNARLAAFAPAARKARLLWLPEDGPASVVQALVESNPAAANAGGTGPGHLNDPGDLRRLPNLGESYRWWEGQRTRDVFAWKPGQAGRWRVWISWGSGWHTHTLAARYVLDRDGDPATTGDQTVIATVDQRLQADGSGEPFLNRPLWSGFKLAGEHDFMPESRIFLRADDSGRPITADVLALEEVRPDEAAAFQPRVRPAVTRGTNVERFAPVPARFVRLTVRATNNGSEPCVDELEVFAANDQAANLALASAGARPSASSEYANNPIHKTAHVNDGRFGNERSWISRESGGGWVQVELTTTSLVNRVQWGRDQSASPRYADRVATDYDISVSLDGASWTVMAGSLDRLPHRGEDKWPPLPTNPDLDPARTAELAGLQARRAELDGRLAALADNAKVYAGRFTAPAKTFRHHRGDPMSPKEEVTPGGLEVLSGFRLDEKATDPERRMALANWLTGPASALTARVAVNRLWHHHFGIGLVETPSDFGTNGGKPSHPELLDELAAELVRQGWRLKPIHRLILNSATYRQSSRPRADGLATDAGNRLLWRHSPHRLEAEALRDTILWTSGKLDLRMGGPGFDLFEPNTNYVKVYATKTRFGPEDFRRMVYQNKPRVELDTLFGAFDCPDAGQITPRRTVSTTPLQALNLLNSAFLLEQSAFFAERLAREASPEGQVPLAFRLALGRAPSPEEETDARALARDHGLAALCRALFNANEFVVID